MAKYDLLTTMSLEIAGFTGNLKKVQATVTDFTSTLNMVGGAMGIAFGVKAIVDFGTECMKLAGAAEGVRNAFMKIGDAQKVLENLKTATRDTISNMGLETLANKATQFNIPMKDLAVYLQFATARALETGESVDELSEKIINGVGRNSPRSFVALGISIKESKEWLQSHATMIGLVTEKLKEMGDAVNTAGVKLQQMNANVANLKVAWGEYLVNSKVAQDMLTGTALTLKRLADPDLNFWEKLMWSGKQYLEWQKGNKLEKSAFGFGTNLSDMNGKLPSVGAGAKPAEVKSIENYELKIKEAENQIKSLDETIDKGLIISLENQVTGWKKNIEAINNYALAADMAKGKADYAKNPLKKISGGSAPTLGSPNVLPNDLAGVGMDLGGQWITGAKAIQVYIDKMNIAKAKAKEMNDTQIKQSILLNAAVDTVKDLGSAFGNLAAGTKGAMKDMVTVVLSGLQKLIDGYLAAAIAATIAGDADVPVIGLALAAVGVAALTAFWAAKVPAFANGGIVGGNSFTGDKVPVMVNSGEMILNRQQQNNMFSGGELTTRVSGSDLIFVLNNAQRKINSYR
jgi:hypothetical protein